MLTQKEDGVKKTEKQEKRKKKGREEKRERGGGRRERDVLFTTENTNKNCDGGRLNTTG